MTGAAPGLGMIFIPHFPPEQLRTVAVAADRAGLDELWLWEDCFQQGGLTAAAAALAWTERLRVGIGLLPVPLRNVALTAMEAAALGRMFPGRLDLGVGHGVQDWMGQVGERVESPLTLLREHTQALQRLLAGENVTVDGRYVHLDDVQLYWPPERPVPVWVGGIGPRTLGLAGEISDGVIITGGTTPQRVAEIRALADDAAERAGRTSPPPVVVFVIACTGPDSRSRYEQEVARWKLDPADDVGVHGDDSAWADAAHRWADAGADRELFQPARDETDAPGLAEFIATDVSAQL